MTTFEWTLTRIKEAKTTERLDQIAKDLQASSIYDMTGAEQAKVFTALNSRYHAIAMETITKKQFYAISKDYRGTYSDYDGKHPDWKGRRTAFLPGHGTTLFIEGISFEII